MGKVGRIEKGIPIPRVIHRKYPFLKMKRGDSILLHLSHAAAHQATRLTRKETGWKFVARKVSPNLTRIWRVK